MATKDVSKQAIKFSWNGHPDGCGSFQMEWPYSVIAADTLRDLVTLIFDHGQWSYMAGHVVNPSTKLEDPTAIHSWVMRSDISHRIPLTMRLQPLRMRRIMWPMRRGHFFPHIWNPWPRFAYSLYNFYGATMTFKGRLLLAPLMLKPFFGRKF